MSDPTTSDLEKSQYSSAPSVGVVDPHTHSSSSAATENEGQILSEYITGFFKLTMWIPGEFTGRVLGKKGAIIMNLKKETRAFQITILSAVGDSLWVGVAITGDWRSITTTYKAISDIVLGEVDDVVLECVISPRRRFFIYGKAKLTAIKSISAKSNVRIFLPETAPNDPAYVANVPMTLEGSFDNVRKAVALLEREAIAYRERHPDGLSAGKKILSKPASAVYVPVIATNQEPASLWPIVETKENEGEKKTDSAPVSARTKETVERHSSHAPKAQETEKFIKLPPKIAAHMLPKNASSTICPMSLIQDSTHTTITKVTASEDRRKGGAGADKMDTSQASKGKSDDTILFRIQGSEENVNRTHECLLQIVNGEQIRNALAKLQGQPGPPRREDSDRHRDSRDRDRERERSSTKRFSDVVKESHGRDREKERDVRPEPSKEKERERKHRPASSGPPAVEEKEKEKEGLWRREKLPEKPQTVSQTVVPSSERSKRRSKSSSSSSGKAAPQPEKDGKKSESKEDSSTKKGAKFVKRVT